MSYSIKKVITIDNNLSIGECENILSSDSLCLGILDENRDITSFVMFKDLSRTLEFNISDYSISLISTLADTFDVEPDKLDECNLKSFAQKGLGRGFFIGKDKKNAESLVVVENSCEKDIHLLEEYEKNIPAKFKRAIELTRDSADRISLPIYLIGGIVRDIIIGKKSVDIDITVEENAIEFSKFLKKEYPDFCRIKETHEDFKTAKVTFQIGNNEIDIDIASTRKEKYTFPASLPLVQEIGCCIHDDLVRRDFSINSMALCLNKNNFCKLVDPLEGYNDLSRQVIRVLHPVSFVDDPTRIIRALKFSSRFDFPLDEATKSLQDKCLNSGLFDKLGGERIKSEIRQTFNTNNPEAFIRFINERIYYLVYKGLPIPEKFQDLAYRCHKIISEYSKYLDSKNYIWLIYLGVLFSEISSDKVIEISNKLYLSGFETEILLGAKSIQNKYSIIKNASSRFEVYEEFEGYFSESILIGLTHCEDDTVIKNMNLYLKELQYITISTTGKTLIEHGFKPGPIFGEILRDLLKAKINGEISTRNDEIQKLDKFSI